MTMTLAVIIPAYKEAYLDETLYSLSIQSCKDFTVYVGDDNGSPRISEIVSKYRDSLNIVYKRFPNNLGRRDLVAQWNRCLDMIGDEEFFCMFSDDDVMEARCIEYLQKTIVSQCAHDVYHFDIKIMDGEGYLSQIFSEYPAELSADEFLYRLYTCRLDARMPEFVFRTRAFREAGGFVSFDLAFRSDNATVLSVAKRRGICTVKGAKVLWRDSGINVSSCANNHLRMRRTLASIDFFNWLEHYYALRHEFCPLPARLRFKQVLREITRLSDCLSLEERCVVLGRLELVQRNSLLYYYGRYKMMGKSVWHRMSAKPAYVFPRSVKP